MFIYHRKHTLLVFQIFIALFWLTIPLSGYDNPHFYRATNFFNQPLVECPWLLSLEASMGFGHAKTSYDRCKQEVPLLDMYGPHSLHRALQGITFPEPLNHYDQLLVALRDLPPQPNLGSIRIGGRFLLRECLLQATYNLCHGLFTGVHLPVRHLAIDHVMVHDAFTTATTATHHIWQNVFDHINVILNRYGTMPSSFAKTGIGDITLYGGWTSNYQNMDCLDFVDSTLQIGLIVPTGAPRNPCNPLSLPLGYNKHCGVSLAASVAVGAYDWLTSGIQCSVIFFAPRWQQASLRSSHEQTGLISFAQKEVKVAKNPLAMIAGFLQMDHVIGGLSLLVGYSWVHQNQNSVGTCHGSSYQLAPMLDNGFSMHTLNLAIHHDFATTSRKCAPHIGVFYNIVLRSSTVFRTAITQPTIGFDMMYTF
jgi:hypothetical protein